MHCQPLQQPGKQTSYCKNVSVGRHFSQALNWISYRTSASRQWVLHWQDKSLFPLANLAFAGWSPHKHVPYAGRQPVKKIAWSCLILAWEKCHNASKSRCFISKDVFNKLLHCCFCPHSFTSAFVSCWWAYYM